MLLLLLLELLLLLACYTERNAALIDVFNDASLDALTII